MKNKLNKQQKRDSGIFFLYGVEQKTVEQNASKYVTFLRLKVTLALHAEVYTLVEHKRVKSVQ